MKLVKTLLAAALATAVTAACNNGGSKTTAKASKTTTTTIATTTTRPKPSWKTTDVKAAGTLTGDGDTVAVVDQSRHPDLQAVVLDAATGTVRFRKQWSVSGLYGGMGVGAPAVVGGVVVTVEETRGDDSVLVGLDAHTGEEKWRQTVPETFTPFVCGTLVCHEDTAEHKEALVARDPATGQVKWQSPGLQSAVVVRPDTLIEMHLGKPVVYSVNPVDGAERWHADLTQPFGRTASTDAGWDGHLLDNVVVASSGDSPEEKIKGGAVGLDAATGALKWTRPSLQLCPVHLPSVVLLCGNEAGIHRVDPATGNDLWASEEFTPPAIDGAFIGVSPDGKTLFGKVKAGGLMGFATDTGATAKTSPGTTSWMLVESNVRARPSLEYEIDDYSGTFDMLPWDAGTDHPAPIAKAADVPPFVGLTLAGYRVFTDGDGNVVGLPS